MNTEPTRPHLAVQPAGSDTLEVKLTGNCTFAAWVPPETDVTEKATGTVRRIRLVDEGIAEWDSALLTFLMKLRTFCEEKHMNLDIAGLPEGVQQLVALATAVPERKGARRSGAKMSLRSWAGEPRTPTRKPSPSSVSSARPP